MDVITVCSGDADDNIVCVQAINNLPGKIGFTANLSINYRAPTTADQVSRSLIIYLNTTADPSFFFTHPVHRHKNQSDGYSRPESVGGRLGTRYQRCCPSRRQVSVFDFPFHHFHFPLRCCDENELLINTPYRTMWVEPKYSQLMDTKTVNQAMGEREPQLEPWAT
jgi:hypothetical protein